MSRNGQRGQVLVSLLLILVLFGLLISGLFMMDRFGLLDAKSRIYAALKPVPYVGEYLAPSPVSRIAYRSERLRKLQQQLDRRERQLQQRRNSLNQEAQELRAKESRLQRLEREIQQRESALLDRKQRFEDREERYQYLANLYSSMRPEDAAQRLGNIQDDAIVIAVLRRMETRSSSIILSNLDPARAADVTRKMARFPD